MVKVRVSLQEINVSQCNVLWSHEDRTVCVPLYSSALWSSAQDPHVSSTDFILWKVFFPFRRFPVSTTFHFWTDGFEVYSQFLVSHFRAELLSIKYWPVTVGETSRQTAWLGHRVLLLLRHHDRKRGGDGDHTLRRCVSHCEVCGETEKKPTLAHGT